MDLLLITTHPGAIRMYESVLGLLRERGHRVELVFETARTPESVRFVQRLAAEKGLEYGFGVPLAEDRWSPLRDSLRHGIDFLRYLEPRYRDAVKLRARAEREAPVAIRRAARRLGPSPRVLTRALQLAERSLPPPPDVTAFVAEKRPDLLLVAPLVRIASRQADFVRAAQRLGIRTALPVLSWDNLTNKGLLRDVPDLVLVWNEEQAAEAVELHGVPRARVAVTGAASYDHWFAWTPSRTREELCAEVGLRSERPFVLWTCSSPFIARDREAAYVRSWLERLRAAGAELAELGVLVRPHPQNADQWREKPLDDAHAVVWPPAGEDPVDDAGRRNYFDSLYHASAVVGLNTSALVEAAIVDRPVLTLLEETFRETQEGTLHFHYLARGHVQTARSFGEHAGQLFDVLSGGGRDDRNHRFVADFLRPHGLERPATPIVVEALERLAAVPARRVRAPLLAAPLRTVLHPAAAQAERRRRTRRGGRPKTEGARAVGAVRRELRTLGRTPRSLPVVAGPWHSEIGHELLYWIPFLRWALEAAPELAGRLVVLSRGGVASWYEGVADRYLDLFDLVSPDELQRRLAESGSTRRLRKQVEATAADDGLVEAAREALGAERVAVLHPSVMFRLYLDLLKSPIAADRSPFRPRPLRVPGLALDLPDDFAAVRFYSNSCFPDTPANRALVEEIVAALAEETEVVLLNPGRRFDDHLDFEPDSIPNVHRLAAELAPAENLAVQSAAIACARLFVGTYGGYSYLPPLLGVPAIGLYSDRSAFRSDHLELASRLFAGPEYGSFLALDAGQLDLIRALARAPARARPATPAVA